MSSSSRSSISACFDSSLDGIRYDFDAEYQHVEVRIITTLYLCAKNQWSNHFSCLECECEESNCESLGCNMFFRIKEVVCRNAQDLQSACLTSDSDSFGFWDSICNGPIYRFWRDTREELCLLLDEHCLVGVPTAGQLMDLIDSLLDLVHELIPNSELFDISFGPDILEALEEKLMLSKKFIRFFTVQGAEHVQLIELLIAVEFVAVKTARLICMFCHSSTRDSQVDYSSEISRLLHEFKPVDPQVRETCIHVLTALKSSRSSSDILLSLGKNWQILAADFLDSLLANLWDLLTYDATCFIISVKDQMHKFNEGVKFLRYLLREHQEKFHKLHDKMKDLVRIVVYDVGIVICSLSPSEMVEGLAKETNNALFHLLEVLEFIMAEVSLFYPSVSSPRTNELGSMDFLLKSIKELASCETDSIAFLKDQIHRVQKDLVFLRSFLQTIAEQRNQNVTLQAFRSRVMEVAYKAEFVIDSVIVGDKLDCSSMTLDTITEEIKFLKIEAYEIDDRMRHYSQPKRITNDFIRMPSQVSTTALNEFLVDLDDEVNAIIDRLERGSKYLDIVSIVGMPGLGKTTLANKVHHNPLIMRHFHIRAWCTVSQVYSKHNLLVQILRDIIYEFPDKCLNVNEADLAEMLYKRLRGNRYLIIFDDVWDIDAWNSLKESFPEDANGSRILFTSRFHNLSLQIKLDSKPHYVRPFTDKESWELLQNKLFGKEGCPLALSSAGMHIAKNCQGLPLTIVIVAGILANSDQDGWERIAGRLSSSALSNTDQCIDILELSFRKLTNNLKSCLLYFGLFPEDKEIPVKKLIWFWIAEGFIKTESKSLEDVAKDYTNDLIGRNLIMVSKEKSTGGVKTCRIHDLLHEFCVMKAKEEKFLSLLSGHDELFTFLGQRDLQRLCVHSTAQDFEKSKLSCPGVRSLLLFTENYDYHFNHYKISFIFHFFKLLKVLDLTNLNLDSTFPSEITVLVELRYLAIKGQFKSITSAVANLSNLETLLVHAYEVLLPDTIWNMRKLRVLWSSGSFLLDRLPIDNLESSSGLHNLDTFSSLKLSSGQSLEKILRKLPNIRRLKCILYGSGESNADCNGIVSMDFLSRLESLHLRTYDMDKYHIVFHFPVNLKKLTLSRFNSCINPKRGELLNLVVLKLKSIDFEGDTWDMSEEWEFPNLKYLKLEDLEINRWTGTDGVDHFPCLEKLVLDACWELEEVPSCLRDITTLQMIVVRWCPTSVESLIMQIKEYQKDNWGNEDLQVLGIISVYEAEDEPCEDEVEDNPSENEMEDETSDEE